MTVKELALREVIKGYSNPTNLNIIVAKIKELTNNLISIDINDREFIEYFTIPNTYLLLYERIEREKKYYFKITNENINEEIIINKFKIFPLDKNCPDTVLTLKLGNENSEYYTIFVFRLYNL